MNTIKPLQTNKVGCVVEEVHRVSSLVFVWIVTVHIQVCPLVVLVWCVGRLCSTICGNSQTDSNDLTESTM